MHASILALLATLVTPAGTFDETPMPPTLTVLFDIDGTLLVRSSSHLAVLASTLSDRVGRPVKLAIDGEWPLLDGLAVSGWIDAQIVRRVLLEHLERPPTVGEVVDVIERYGERFRETLLPEEAGTVVPGVRACLAQLLERGVRLGLVTGNASPVARAKLRAVGLDSYFTFDRDLGFGDWRESRIEAVAAAVAAERVDDPARTVVTVGDTTADMAAASAARALGVGVLTGAASGTELAAAGAWRVIPSAAVLPHLALELA